MIKKIRKLIFWIVTPVIVYMLFILAYGTLTDFVPDDIIEIETEKSASITTIKDSVLSVAIWNLGYAGLGEESDFFYDTGRLFFSGGHDVRPTKKVSEKNYGGILQWASSTKADFFLLQEVDRSSKRSYRQDQFMGIAEQLNNYYAGFAVNYKASWVPMPVFEPWHLYGKVYSGLGTYAKYQPSKATRYQLPGEENWPVKNYELDRCAGVFRFAHENGKEFVIINVHNSAYDKGGKIKKVQMRFLRDFLQAEYQKGNYVMAGGDWNQCPPFFKTDGFLPGSPEADRLTNVSPGFLPEDWTWVYDPTTPTHRSIKEPYQPKQSFVTILDFFVISPNLKVKKIKGMNLNFKFSDHQPVWVELELD